LVIIDTSDHSLIDNHGARHAVQTHFVRAPEYGIVDVLINGSRVGEAVDTFKKTDDLTPPIWPPAGVDAGAASGGYLKYSQILSAIA
jgi:hypothetical protein